VIIRPGKNKPGKRAKIRRPVQTEETEVDSGTEQKKAPLFTKRIIFSRMIFSRMIFPGILFLFVSFGLVFTACSFDYGIDAESNKGKPDIIMENLEYVRVRKGDPLARIQAEHAERWEERQTMELRDFSFEQMDDNGNNVNADGRAGMAIIQLESGDISLKGGVRIRVDSEDVIISTAELEWNDKEKILSGGVEDEVDIERSDGTIFSGIGFYANARSRTWSFAGEVKGTFVEKDDEEDEEETEEAVDFSEEDI